MAYTTFSSFQLKMFFMAITIQTSAKAEEIL